MNARQLKSLKRCYHDPAYFISQYCQIEDSVTRKWVPFELWESQALVVRAVHQYQYFIGLKARQVGFTWLALSYALYAALFQPIQQINIFSKRERESIHLLNDRLKGMYNRLPEWLQSPVERDSKTEWQLSNGSIIRALPTDVEGAGDTYTATLAIFDEADLTDRFEKVLVSIMPSIEAGGKLIVFSRANKLKPNSHFKQVFDAAVKQKNNFAYAFMPWHAHPGRDKAWYQAMQRQLTQDELWEQYPETIAQALAIASTGLVYPAFDPRYNVTELAEYDPALPVYWSVDDGYTDPRSIGFWQVKTVHGIQGCACCFAEYYQTEETADMAIANALKLPYKKPDLIYYDPAAVQFAATAFNQFGLFCRSGYNKIHDGLKVVRRFIHDHNGARRLLIHPRCERRIGAMLHYHYSDSQVRTGGELTPAHDEYSHAADDTRYFVATHMYHS